MILDIIAVNCRLSGTIMIGPTTLAACLPGSDKRKNKIENR